MFWVGYLFGAFVACIAFTRIFFFLTRNRPPMSAQKIIGTYFGFAVIASAIYTFNSMGGGEPVAIFQRAVLGYGSAAIVVGLIHLAIFQSRQGKASP